MKKYQYGFSIIEILVTLVAIGLLSGVGFYIYTSRTSNTTVQTDGTDKESTGTLTGLKYENKDAGISFLIPAGWHLEKTPLAEGGEEDISVVSPNFQLEQESPHGELNFGGSFRVQVYKTAFKSTADFAKNADGPGSPTNPTTIQIDGIAAIREEKCGHPVLNATCVWVVKGGLKYDIWYTHTKKETSSTARYMPEYNKLLASFRFN